MLIILVLGNFAQRFLLFYRKHIIMSKKEKAVKTVVDAPESEDASTPSLTTPEQDKILEESVTLYAGSKQYRHKCESLIVQVLGKTPTFTLFNHCKEYFVKRLRSLLDKADSTIIDEVNKLFFDVMAFHNIPVPVSESKSATKTRESRARNDKATHERLKKQGLLDKSAEDLRLALRKAHGEASQSHDERTEKLAESQIDDINKALKLAKAKAKAEDKELIKNLRASCRTIINEESRLRQLKEMESVLFNIANRTNSKQ